MKTGRLLKLPRPGAELHVYLYQDGPEMKAAVYALSGEARSQDPIHVVSGASEARVEAEARSWVDTHFPKTTLPKDGPR
jgi:hypothetical protein